MNQNKNIKAFTPHHFKNNKRMRLLGGILCQNMKNGWGLPFTIFKKNNSNNSFLSILHRNMKNGEGFTIIEALVVIAIIIILTSVLTLNYPSMRNKFALLRSAHQLAQDLRRAQEMATSAKKISGGDVPAGYGIYLIEGTGQTSYILYADTDPLEDQQYTADDITVESGVKLEEKVYIKDIYGLGVTSVSINFKGPDPVTNISSGANEITITLALENDINTTQEVVVNKAGLIYVK